jgi:hypothetical protein
MMKFHISTLSEISDLLGHKRKIAQLQKCKATAKAPCNTGRSPLPGRSLLKFKNKRWLSSSADISNSTVRTYGKLYILRN